MSIKKANKKLTTVKPSGGYEEENLSSNEEDGVNEEFNSDDDNEDDDDDYEESLVDEEFEAEDEYGNKRPFKRKHDEVNGDNDDDQKDSKKAKKKKKKITVSTKPPTAEEMSRLRETENLFHSNLFRMQIEEMIKEVRTKKVERKSMKSWLEKLKNYIMEMDDLPVCLLHDTEVDGIHVPICNIPQESKGFFRLMKPESVNIIGSYKAGCCLGPDLKVDVAVVIPKKCFLKEDYLNARYHRKRAFYLAVLAKHLKASNLVRSNIEYCAKDGHPIKSCLLVHPEGILSYVSVYIYVVPNGEAFKFSRFLPDKCNVRESWWTSGKTEDSYSRTPQYNSTIIKDLVLMENEEVRAKVLETNSNLKDAIALLQVWLKQRELDVGYGGFTGYLVSMLVVHLMRCRRLNNLMSSYQVVRNVWLMLSQTDWTKEGITMTSQQDNNLQLFHQFYEVVFLDVTGFCNLAATLTRHTYLRVKKEAELALKCLDNPDMNSFQALFMTPVPFFRQFDHVVCVRNQNAVKKVIKEHSSLEEQMDYMWFSKPLFIKTLTDLLSKGLTGRVLQMAVKLTPPVTWPVHSGYTTDSTPVLIGLQLNPDTALKIVEKGPPANLPEAETFRAFWGSKSELRRFKDSTVCEAVVWAQPSASICTKRLIVRDIVSFLLKEKLHLQNTDFNYIADQLEPLIQKKTVIPDEFEYGTGEEACRKVIQSFDQLAKQLRDLKDLPLDIVSTQGISPVFRYCDVFPPLSTGYVPPDKCNKAGPKCLLLNENLRVVPLYTYPVEAVIQLGLSRKWPEDQEAVRRIRAAFNIQIAEMLSSNYKLETQPFTEFVDVFKDGFVFRLRVAYAREIVLLKETVLPDGKITYRDTHESLQLGKMTLHLPKLTGAISGLSLQHPGFGPATRLAKRWLNSQLLDSSHFPDVVTELLMAYVFLSPEPFETVLQPQTAFLRFLNLVATTNWHLEPIIVNFNSDMKRDDLLEIESHFRNERSTLPQLFIATQYDKTSSLWTKEAPSLPVLMRLAKLAAESLKITESNFLVSSDHDVFKQIFRPPLDIYDVLIRIYPHFNAHKFHGVDWVSKQPPKNVTPLKKDTKIPVTGFDPVQCYLDELRGSYDDFALFFHDSYGGNVIGVLLKPTGLKPQEFKASHVNCRKPKMEGKSAQLTLNIDAVVEDFYIIGKDLVESIDVNPRLSSS